MLAFLALGPDGVRARRRIEGMLWGSRGQKQAQDSLRRELSNLRKRLRAADADHILKSELRRVTLALEHVDVDMLDLERRRLPSEGRLAGDFMEGIDLADADEFEDWLRDQRDRARDLYEELKIREPNSPDAVAETAAPAFVSARPTPKPALAVLPFATLPATEDDPRGMIFSEMLALCLSEFPQLLVVSGNAAAEALARESSRQAVAARLDVQYLVEGTAFLAEDGGQCRVFSKIVYGNSGEQVWSGQFEGRQDDALTFERTIAEAIAPQIWTGIDLNERRRVLQMRVPATSSYDRYWQANALYRSWRPADLREAARVVSELVVDEPNCAWATSLAAFCHAGVFLLGGLDEPEDARRTALAHFETAMRVGSDNLESLGYCAGTLMLLGEDIDRADLIIARALAIMPEHQPALFWGGWVDLARGNVERALTRFELALRVNPTSNAGGEINCGMAFCHVVKGAWREARASLDAALAKAPDFPLVGFVEPLVASGESDPEAVSLGPDILASAVRVLPQLIRARQAQ